MSEESSNMNPEALHLISNLQPSFQRCKKHIKSPDIFANIVHQADLKSQTTLHKIKSKIKQGQ